MESVSLRAALFQRPFAWRNFAPWFVPPLVVPLFVLGVVVVLGLLRLRHG
jgi:hypothetical protein